MKLSAGRADQSFKEASKLVRACLGNYVFQLITGLLASVSRNNQAWKILGRACLGTNYEILVLFRLCMHKRVGNTRVDCEETPLMKLTVPGSTKIQ